MPQAFFQAIIQAESLPHANCSDSGMMKMLLPRHSNPMGFSVFWNNPGVVTSGE
jgi:hypothetical protein